MNARPQRSSSRDREVSLVLNESGAELIDNGTGTQLWASDTDDDFREDFPELLTVQDVEEVLDYLVHAELITDDEADEADILVADDGPGEENGDDDDDGDDNGDEDDFDDDE